MIEKGNMFFRSGRYYVSMETVCIDFLQGWQSACGCKCSSGRTLSPQYSRQVQRISHFILVWAFTHKIIRPGVEQLFWLLKVILWRIFWYYLCCMLVFYDITCAACLWKRSPVSWLWTTRTFKQCFRKNGILEETHSNNLCCSSLNVFCKTH